MGKGKKNQKNIQETVAQEGVETVTETPANEVIEAPSPDAPYLGISPDSLPSNGIHYEPETLNTEVDDKELSSKIVTVLNLIEGNKPWYLTTSELYNSVKLLSTKIVLPGQIQDELIQRSLHALLLITNKINNRTLFYTSTDGSSIITESDFESLLKKLDDLVSNVLTQVDGKVDTARVELAHSLRKLIVSLQSYQNTYKENLKTLITEKNQQVRDGIKQLSSTENLKEKVNSLLLFAQPYVQDAVARGRPLVETAIETSKPYIEQVLETSKPLLEQAQPYYNPVVDKIKEKVPGFDSYLEVGKELANNAIEQTLNYCIPDYSAERVTPAH